MYLTAIKKPFFDTLGWNCLLGNHLAPCLLGYYRPVLCDYSPKLNQSRQGMI